MVGVWEGLNLGSIPNDHIPSQKDPKISIDRRCSTILPPKALVQIILILLGAWEYKIGSKIFAILRRLHMIIRLFFSQNI